MTHDHETGEVACTPKDDRRLSVLMWIIGLVLPGAIAWAIWVTAALLDVKYGMGDRWTGAMQVEYSSRLRTALESETGERHTGVTATEIREIQRNNKPHLKQ